MTLKVSASGDRGLVVTRRFAAPVKLVWDCHSQPDLVHKWLLGPPGWTMPVCEIDFREGGGFRYVWEREGTEMGLTGTFREIVSQVRIVHTEVFDEDWTGGESIVTTQFTGDGAGTIVTLNILYASTEARDGAHKSGMADGMEYGFGNLDKMLEELAG